MSKNSQINLAEMYGYVESVGDRERGLRRGDLVPYDDPTSPLSWEDIDALKQNNTPVGKIGSFRKDSR